MIVLALFWWIEAMGSIVDNLGLLDNVTWEPFLYQVNLDPVLLRLGNAKAKKIWPCSLQLITSKVCSSIA